MKKTLISILALAVGVGHAANVQWNMIRANGGTGLNGYLMIDHRLESPQTILRSGSLSLGLESTPLGGDDFSVRCALVNAWFVGIWAEACYGDIACQETLRGAGPYFLRSDENDFSGYSIIVQGDSDFYLMFACTEMGDDGHLREEAIYGWINFHVDEDGALSLLESAYDADGGPMVVGGGSALHGDGSAIPEPSSALLLIVGGALLALVRLKGVQRNLIR